MEASNQWRSRPDDQCYKTLADLRDAVNSRRMRSRSLDIDRNNIKVIESPNGGLLLNSNIEPCSPTHWAFGQLCQASRINGVTAPANYMRQLPTPLAVQCLNQGLQSGDREANKFMTIRSEDPNQPNILQAVTSPTYGRIWDADCVDAVSRIVERTGGRFTNPPSMDAKRNGLYASDHDVFMFMVDGGHCMDISPRAQLHKGFIVFNSETGARTLGIMMFMFNHVCGNHMIWGAQNVERILIRHTAGGPSRFDLEAAPALKAHAEASAAPIETAVRKAQDFLLPPAAKGEEEKTVLDFITKHGVKLTRSEVAGAIHSAKAEEGDCRTLWQLFQGATAYARGFDFIDARVDVERRAGKLMEIVSGN